MEKENKNNIILTILKPALLIVSTLVFFAVKRSRKKNRLENKE